MFDSLTASPLAGANVQLVGADSAVRAVRLTALSDSAGAFLVRGVPAGHYVVGFYHPALDTLGIEVRDRMVNIDIGNAFVALGTPSAATLSATLCGVSGNTDSAATTAVVRSGVAAGSRARRPHRVRRGRRHGHRYVGRGAVRRRRVSA